MLSWGLLAPTVWGCCCRSAWTLEGELVEDHPCELHDPKLFRPAPKGCVGQHPLVAPMTFTQARGDYYQAVWLCSCGIEYPAERLPERQPPRCDQERALMGSPNDPPADWPYRHPCPSCGYLLDDHGNPPPPSPREPFMKSGDVRVGQRFPSSFEGMEAVVKALDQDIHGPYAIVEIQGEEARRLGMDRFFRIPFDILLDPWQFGPPKTSGPSAPPDRRDQEKRKP